MTLAMQLVALTGPAGAGKDTAADILVQYARFRKLAFAEPLRAEVAQAFDIDWPRLLEDRALKETPHPALALRECQDFAFIGAVAIADHATVNSEWLDAPRSPRQILQWWGTEFRRAQDDAYWVKAMAARLAAYRDAGDRRFVITDCRFLNERAYVQLCSGRLWRIQRDGLAPVEGAHSSATNLRDVKADVDLVNNGTVDQLRGEVLRHWWSTDSGIAPEQLRVEVLA